MDHSQPENSVSSSPESEQGEKASPGVPAGTPKKISLEDLYADESVSREQASSTSEKKMKPGETRGKSSPLPISESPTTRMDILLNVPQLQQGILTRNLFHLGISLGVWIVVFFISMLLSGISFSVEETNSLTTIEPLHGDVSIHDQFTNKAQPVETTLSLSEQGALESAENSEAVLSFPRRGEVRMQGATRLTFEDRDGVPFIFLERGDIWVFSPQRIEVKTPHYHFFVDTGTTRFTTTSDRTIVKVWDNSLKVLINDNGGEMFLPMLSRAVFSEVKEGMLSGKILTELLFSKLLKEFHVTGATPDTWDTANLNRDALTSEKWSKELLEQHASVRGFFEKLQYRLSFFPARKAERMASLWQHQKDILFASLGTGKTSGWKANITAPLSSGSEQVELLLSELDGNQEKLRELLQEIKLVEGFLAAYPLRQKVENMLLAKLKPTDVGTFEEEILRNAFHGLQEALETQNEAWRDSELRQIQNIWEKTLASRDRDINNSDLTGHRENLFRLFLRTPHSVNDTLLSFLQFLDDAEIKLAAPEEKNATQLEIVYRDLALTNGFINAGETDLAQTMLNKSSSILETTEIHQQKIALQNIRQQEDTLSLRLRTCKSFQACTDQEFRDWQQGKRIIACQFSGVCGNDEFQEWLRNFLEDNLKAAPVEPENIGESEDIGDPLLQAHAMLEAADITPEEVENSEEEGFVKVVRARISGDIVFSALLSIRYAYFKDVKLADGTPIVGIVSVPSLEQVIYRALAAEVETPKDSENESDKSENKTTLTPQIAELVVRGIQPKLLDAGLIVFRTDILAQTTTTGRVGHAVVGPDQIAVQFEYVLPQDADESVLKNVTFTKYPDLLISEIPLSKAESEIIDLAEKERKRQKLISDALQAFARIDLSTSEHDLRPNIQNGTVAFTHLEDKQNGVTLVGEFNPNTQTFLTITDARRTWEFLNLHINKYQKSIESQLSEQNTSSDNLFLLASLPEGVTPEEELSAVFSRYGLQFDSESFEIDDSTKKVFFVGVFMPQENVFLSGEYDAKKHIFPRIAGASIGMQEDISFEEFLNLLG